MSGLVLGWAPHDGPMVLAPDGAGTSVCPTIDQFDRWGGVYVTLREIQEPIKARYRTQPDAARITLQATGSTAGGAMSCSIDLGRALYAAGAHPGVGGSDLLTDLHGRDFAANNRIRREATPILVEAAVAARVRRLVIESIGFDVASETAAARDEMERTAHASGLEVAVVHLGRLWGPGTWSALPGDDGNWMSIEQAADLLRDATLS